MAPWLIEKYDLNLQKFQLISKNFKTFFMADFLQNGLCQLVEGGIG